MSDPVSLKPGYSADLVPMLTELLRRAQAGEITQAAVAYLGSDRAEYGTWISNRAEQGAHGHSTLALIGAVTDLQFTLLTLHNQQQD